MPDYLLGGSPAIKRIRASLTKLSADTSPLVIIGEPGVGKSLLSSRIHAHSLFKDHELETVNFKILSERDQRIRLLGGNPPEIPTTRRSVLELPTTIVLKHVDCSSKFLQEKLFEAIQSNTIARLGTTEQRPICCRLIYIFNKPPSVLLKEGRLISALSKLFSKYQTIELPQLQKRKQDIPELAQHFFTQYQIQQYMKLDRQFINLLMKHKWETNVLDLKSFIKSLEVLPNDVAILQKDKIELTMMNLMIDERKEFSAKNSFRRVESSLIHQALKKYRNCQTEAAQALGMSEYNLRRIIKSSQ